jgi:hypothetical protein
MKMDWSRLESECIYDSFDKKLINTLNEKFREEKFSFIYIRLDNSKIFYKFEKCLNV